MNLKIFDSKKNIIFYSDIKFNIKFNSWFRIISIILHSKISYKSYQKNFWFYHKRIQMNYSPNYLYNTQFLLISWKIWMIIFLIAIKNQYHNKESISYKFLIFFIYWMMIKWKRESYIIKNKLKKIRWQKMRIYFIIEIILLPQSIFWIYHTKKERYRLIHNIVELKY